MYPYEFDYDLDPNHSEWEYFTVSQYEPNQLYPPAYPVEPVPQYKTYRGDCSVDNDLVATTDTTFEGCLGSCRTNPKCVGFSFNPENSRCYLKPYPCEINDLYDRASDYHYTLVQNLNPYVRLYNGDCSYNNNLTSTGDTTYEGCLNSCHNDPRCVGFSFDPNHQNPCYLKPDPCKDPQVADRASSYRYTLVRQ